MYASISLSALPRRYLEFSPALIFWKHFGKCASGDVGARISVIDTDANNCESPARCERASCNVSMGSKTRASEWNSGGGREKAREKAREREISGAGDELDAANTARIGDDRAGTAAGSGP